MSRLPNSSGRDSCKMTDTWANDMARDMDMDKAAASGIGSLTCTSFSQIDTFLQHNIMTVTTIQASSDDSDTYEYDDLSDSLQGEIELELSESPVGESDILHQIVGHEETVGTNCHTRITREEKNERERTRIKKKGDLLDELKELIKNSNLIPSDAKRKRFTEMYTLKLAQELIIAHHEELKQLGQSSRLPLPFSSSQFPHHKHPPLPKQYAKFEKTMRSSCESILRNTVYLPGEKVDEAQLSQFIGQIWQRLSASERQLNWTAISSDKKSQIVKYASDILNES